MKYVSNSSFKFPETLIIRVVTFNHVRNQYTNLLIWPQINSCDFMLEGSYKGIKIMKPLSCLAHILINWSHCLSSLTTHKRDEIKLVFSGRSKEEEKNWNWLANFVVGLNQDCPFDPWHGFKTAYLPSHCNLQSFDYWNWEDTGCH